MVDVAVMTPRPGELEHVNLTVADPASLAEVLCDLFDWKIRWQGGAIHSGRSIHVGTDRSYLAIYAPPGDVGGAVDNYRTRGGLNHIGVVVGDLDEVEARVLAAGFAPHSHADYAPGRRFYFDGPEGVEIEVVSYAPAAANAHAPVL